MKNLGRTGSLIAAAFAAGLLGCASLPEVVNRNPSSAFTEPETTFLGQFFSDGMATHPGESALVLLDSGRQALLGRLAMIEVAERSIDAQYFIWHGDDSGRIMMDALFRAADRGVRVRLLLDDSHAAGQDLGWNRIDSHPNVEVRIFNPFATRSSTLGRGAEMIGRLSRLQHRMHNKLLAVDGQIGVVGGRNIGDEYFGVHPDFNMRDLDIALSGPVIADLLQGYDAFWNSEWAFPITALKTNEESEAELAELRHGLQVQAAALEDFPYPVHLEDEEVKDQLRALENRFVWAPARAVFDHPGKMSGEPSTVMYDSLAALAAEVQREVLISSPYFSPTEEAFLRFEAGKARGVRTRLLTNSLASTNIVAAHSVYAKYRRRILSSGVEVFELRNDPALRQGHLAAGSQDSEVGLHAKVAVFDRSTVFIGSYNFNKAGAVLSTETAVIIESPELAEAVVAILVNHMEPENSWKVWLEQQPEDVGSTSGQLVWTGEKDGQPERFTHEPNVGFSRRLSLIFYRIIPLKNKI